MRLSFRKASPLQLQLLVWGFVFLFNFLTYLPMDGFGQSLLYAVMGICFYAIIIYGNISLLFPRLFEKGKIAWYVLAITTLLAAVGAARGALSVTLYNKWFNTTGKPEVFGLKTWLYVTIAGIIVYILSFVFRIAIAYFQLKQQAQQMLAQKSQAELNLLKSQVQPHFLFNTLNNIYYEAYREAPRTALLIGRLSDIMRYFVDESPKERVALTTEIKFLENYIALEEIRIRHGVRVTFDKTYEGEPFLPPMLLMTFVENIFKHGIDRGAPGNSISLSLSQTQDFLVFRTQNVLPAGLTTLSSTIPGIVPANSISPAGSGLKNLQKRLTLLYGSRFELATTRTDTCFHAYLKIPLV
jgi:hypothetical protein